MDTLLVSLISLYILASVPSATRWLALVFLPIAPGLMDCLTVISLVLFTWALWSFAYGTDLSQIESKY